MSSVVVSLKARAEMDASSESNHFPLLARQRDIVIAHAARYIAIAISFVRPSVHHALRTTMR